MSPPSSPAPPTYTPSWGLPKTYHELLCEVEIVLDCVASLGLTLPKFTPAEAPRAHGEAQSTELVQAETEEAEGGLPTKAVITSLKKELAAERVRRALVPPTAAWSDRRRLRVFRMRQALIAALTIGPAPREELLGALVPRRRKARREVNWIEELSEKIKVLLSDELASQWDDERERLNWLDEYLSGEKEKLLAPGHEAFVDWEKVTEASAHESVEALFEPRLTVLARWRVWCEETNEYMLQHQIGRQLGALSWLELFLQSAASSGVRLAEGLTEDAVLEAKALMCSVLDSADPTAAFQAKHVRDQFKINNTWLNSTEQNLEMLTGCLAEVYTALCERASGFFQNCAIAAEDALTVAESDTFHHLLGIQVTHFYEHKAQFDPEGKSPAEFADQFDEIKTCVMIWSFVDFSYERQANANKVTDQDEIERARRSPSDQPRFNIPPNGLIRRGAHEQTNHTPPPYRRSEYALSSGSVSGAMSARTARRYNI